MATSAHEPAREGVFLVGLFVVSLALRWQFSDGDFIGDDAWYLYLARGFGLEPGVQAEQPWFHIANRPLFYGLFHLSTYAGLWGFRLAGCCVGATIPLLGFVTARALGAAGITAALAALSLCVQRVQLESSAYVLPDILATAFALSACWAAARRTAAWTFVLSLASVWTKESFVLLPFIATWLRLQANGRLTRPDAWAWLTCLIPSAYVVTLSGVGLHLPGLRMQGWSLTPFTLRHARNMLVGPELWPVLLWLAWRRQTRTLLLWLALPLFYLAWNKLLGRGMAPWYSVGPAALSSVAAALGLDALWAECQRRRLSRALTWLVLVTALTCLAPVPVLGLARVRAQLRQLGGRWPQPTAAPEVRAILAREKPERVLVIDCFWAYRYSHLRSVHAPGTALWWSGPEDEPSILAAARESQVVIACVKPEHGRIQDLLKQTHSALLLESDRWLVIGGPSLLRP